MDEALCLLDSLKIINTNFSNLSAAVEDLNNVSNYLNGIYTLFSQSSASWINFNLNLSNKTSFYDQAYTIVNQNSSFWSNEFSIFYTKMYEIVDWAANWKTYATNDVKNWLNSFFLTKDFPDNQKISVYVNIQEDYYFDIARNYTPLVTYSCGSAQANYQSLSCSPVFALENSIYGITSRTLDVYDFANGCYEPVRGCHKVNNTNNSPTSNAYASCSANTYQVSTQPDRTWSSCSVDNYNNILNFDSYSYTTRDRFISRTVRLIYQKFPNSNTWTFLNI